MIDSFTGEYRFLSNFHSLECNLCHEGISYPTTEHFYVAMKTIEPTERFRISKIETPGKAKREGRKLLLRDDWDDRLKIAVMRAAIKYKFSLYNPNLKRKLLLTEEQELKEGNGHKDYFFGVDNFTGEGLNWLGKILMDRRAELTKETLIKG